MRIKSLLGLAAMLTAACLFLSACNDDGGKPSASNDAKAAEAAKWNAYVSLSNDSGGFMSRMASYFAVFGADAEPHVDSSTVAAFLGGRQTPVSFLKRIPQDVCDSVITEAGKTPQSELDKKALAYAQSIRAIWTTFKDVLSYYEAKSYADDGLAKGRQLHAAMLSEFGELQRTHESFSIAMTEQNTLNMLRDAKDMRAEGMKLTPAALEFVVAARAVSAELERQQLTEDTVYTLDTAAFKPQYDELVKALTEVQTAGDDKAQMEKEGLDAGRVETVVSYAKKIKGSATGIMELAAKGEPKKNAFKMTDFNQRMNKEYNTPKDYDWLLEQLIGSYNRLLETRKAR